MKKKRCGIPYENQNDFWGKFFSLMRKSLILFAVFVNVSVFAFSQKVTLNVESKPIYEVLNTLTKKTGVDFFYNYDVFDVKELVDVNVKDKDLINVVSDIIGSEYEAKFKDDKLIIIVPKTSDEIDKSKGQQEKKVTGVVSDKNGVGIPGVTVINKSKKAWAVTEANGGFKLSVEPNDTLSFSFLGYKELQVPVDNRIYIAVEMEEQLTELNSIDVIALSNGYTEIPKERVTGSFEMISAKDLEKTPTIDINARIEGQVPGVNVDIKTGKIEIRGTNSYSRTSPLVIIDGFPMPVNDFEFTKRSQGKSILSYLNSDDIKSISILKDAAAAAIWGSRAANGVIVIKTKKGRKSQAPSVNFSSTSTIGSKISLDKLRQMSTSDYVDFEKEMVTNGFLVDNNWNWQNTNPSEVQSIMFQAQRGEITETQQEAMLNELSARDNKGQINKYLLGNSVSQQYDFSISGGSDAHTYFISTGYNENDAVMKGNNSSAYYVTVNNSIDLNSFLSLETGINYVKSDYKQNNTASDALSNATSSPYNASSALHPYTMIADADGNAIERYIRFTPETIQGFEGQGYLPWTYNYLDELNRSNINTVGNNIRLNAKLTATLTDWLSVEGSGMYTSFKNTTSTLNESESYFTRNLLNEATSYQNEALVYGIPYGAYFYTENNQNISQSMRLQFNLNKSFENMHDLSFLAGSEIREERREGSSQTRYGYDTNTNTSQSINPTEYYTTIFGWDTFVGSSDQYVSKYRDRYLSYYALGSYAYNSKYNVSGSIRLDDYNLLGVSRKNRALPLWSAGASWNINKEEFLSNVKWLNVLNLRATYGKTGSSPAGGFGSSSALISVGYNDWDTQLPIASISIPENSELKWETTKSWNIGLDFGVFNNRLAGNVDLYSKKSEDILFSLPYNPTYGWSYLEYNTGTLEGNGIDFGLTGLIFKGDFQWRSVFNFSYNTNEVTDSRFEATTTDQLLAAQGLPITGKSLGSVYAYKWAGLDNTGQSQIYAENGDILDAFVGNGDIQIEDLKYMGTSQAPYFGGFTNTFSYKNFNLGVHMTYYLGHVFKNRVLQNYPSYTGAHYGSVSNDDIVADRWQSPGDELNTDVPGLVNISYNSLSRFQNADINVLPAGHIRLQQISLGYTVPGELLKNLFFKSIGVSFAARNLGIIWRKNDQGIDPQYMSVNSYSTLPPERNYSLRFNLGF